jgi:hypothetical protein
VFKPLPSDDPHRRRPDITLAREKLSWAPKVQLRDGLEQTIDYFKAVISANPGADFPKRPRSTTAKELASVRSESTAL